MAFERTTPQKFKGRRVAISGACGGFGQAMAREFQSEGAQLMLLDRDPERLRQLRSELSAEVNLITYDQSDEASVTAALSQVEAVDVFVNNAGYTVRKPLLEFQHGEMRKLLDVDLYGAMQMAIGMARIMVRQSGGVIVNIASQLAFASEPDRGIYSVAKAGLVQFTKNAGREWASQGVRTFAIAPGVAETDMTANLSDSAKANLMAKVFSNKLIQPEEIARMTCFLSSDDASCFVGQTIIVDSGYLLH